VLAYRLVAKLMVQTSSVVPIFLTGLLIACLVLAPGSVESTTVPTTTQNSTAPHPDVQALRFLAVDSDGNAITDLQAGDLSLTIDKRPRKIVSLSSAAPEPRTIGIFFDVSGSRRSDTLIPRELEEIAKFLESIWRSDDVAFIVVFGGASNKLVKPSNDLLQIRSELQKVPDAPFFGPTPLYDALCSIRVAEPRIEIGERLFIVVGDFEDNSSRIDLKKALEMMQEEKARVFPVLLISEPKIAMRRSDKTARLFAEKTGGDFFRVKEEQDLALAFRRLRSELQGAYRLTYESSPPEGAHKHLQVQTTRSNVQLFFAH
jgi:VWFA-related protein